MATGSWRTRSRLAVGVLAAALALVAAAAPTASAAHTATAKATSNCWLQVVNDWLQHGTVKGVYPIPCYTQAVQHLNAYPDIKQYSSAIDDIKRALQVAIHNDRGGGSPTGGDGKSSSGGGGAPGGGGGGGRPSGGSSSSPSGDSGFFHSVAKDIGPGNAQSIPLPLLVLGGLGLLLLLTAAATWVTRRLQARRITPAPATARAGSSVRREP